MQDTGCLLPQVVLYFSLVESHLDTSGDLSVLVNGPRCLFPRPRWGLLWFLRMAELQGGRRGLPAGSGMGSALESVRTAGAGESSSSCSQVAFLAWRLLEGGFVLGPAMLGQTSGLVVAWTLA